ncbi:MAG TPA: peptide chain release factor N(5)-glutamine methyltransferase [Candidatus Saccharibacteria bacterium]|nr:peptide chain release factor N(5)-glutamine methyltransferase [Candidatus Saccharibacteria bacterium]
MDMTTAGWIAHATKQLISAGITSAQLDSELILAHTLRKNRTYLHAHPDEKLGERHQQIADARLSLRLDRVPVAYIVGHKEFYGRRFRVTPATLIPRPESEVLIDLLHEGIKFLAKDSPHRLADVGTGSGCLGITAKLEYPDLLVTLLDKDRHALAVASSNAKEHKADVLALESDLLTSYPYTASIIVANLPYVDKSWERSPETEFEPAGALFADQRGLALIFRLIEQAPKRLISGGLLILEADPKQHQNIIQSAQKHGLLLQKQEDYGLMFTKIV